MSWWKRKKCATCKKVLKKKHPSHELRLNTADGIVELEVCEECARFWDGSAEVLSGRRREKKPTDSAEDAEVYGEDDE